MKMTREQILASPADWLTQDQIRRFWVRAEPHLGNCLVWHGATNSGGYGTVVFGRDHVNVNFKTHRLAYMLAKGPIPDGLQVDHLCRVRKCVNPAHLEAVTQKENILRGVGAPALNSRKTHCPNGHPLAGENVYTKPATNGRACRICKKDYQNAYRAAHK